MLSVHLRTDPRDPANTAHTPGWLVALRNGLRDVSQVAEEQGPREDRLALRELRARVEATCSRPTPTRAPRPELVPHGRRQPGRTGHAAAPTARSRVRWDARPFVSTLVDVEDRGRGAGRVPITAEALIAAAASRPKLAHMRDSSHALAPDTREPTAGPAASLGRMGLRATATARSKVSS